MTQMISRIGKLTEIKKTRQADAFLLGSASSVKYFSNYFFYFEYGPSPFHLLPAVLMVVPEQDAALFLADNEAGQSDTIDPLLRIIPYESYRFENPPDPSGEIIKKLIEFIHKNKLSSGRIGIERKDTPFFIIQALSEIFPLIKWVDIAEDITLLKQVKDADEITCIRKATALADTGQESVLKNAKEGMTELELFALVHRDMETSVGHRVPLMSDLSCGINTNAGGGMPTNNKIRPGDLVLSDFQPCLQGYWGDSCNTMVIGSPTAEQKKNFLLVKEALEIGIENIKPGVQAKKVDRLMRDHIGNYPHHSGHGVGTFYHEGPRITPYNETELAPGMIIALEPAIYKEDYGIRLEHVMLVTGSGCEVLTKFKHRFEK